MSPFQIKEISKTFHREKDKRKQLVSVSACQVARSFLKAWSIIKPVCLKNTGILCEQVIFSKGITFRSVLHL